MIIISCEVIRMDKTEGAEFHSVQKIEILDKRGNWTLVFSICRIEWVRVKLFKGYNWVHFVHTYSVLLHWIQTSLF